LIVKIFTSAKAHTKKDHTVLKAETMLNCSIKILS
jgi:hypothetical protein